MCAWSWRSGSMHVCVVISPVLLTWWSWSLAGQVDSRHPIQGPRDSHHSMRVVVVEPLASVGATAGAIPQDVGTLLTTATLSGSGKAICVLGVCYRW
jgi:hypothetical protein